MNARGPAWVFGACLLVSCAGEKTDEFGSHSRGEPTLLSEQHDAVPSTLDIAVNSAGQALVYWIDFDREHSQLWLARYTPTGGWEPANTLTSGIFNSYQVAIDDNGNALAVWTETDAERWLVKASRFTVGAGWSAPESLEEDASVQPTDVALSMDSAGNAMAVWSGAVVRARLFDPNSGWATTTTIGSNAEPTATLLESNGSAPAYPAGVVLCNDGSAVAMWGSYGGQLLGYLATHYPQPPGLYVNRYSPSDGWSGAASGEGLGAIQDSPQLRCDREGRIAAAWPVPAHPQMATSFARDDAAGSWHGGLLHLGSSGAQMALTDAGDALVVLNNQFENGPVEAFLDTPSAGLVEERTLESNTDGTLTSIDLGANAEGKALAIWARAAGHGDDIWINARDPETGWGRLERLVAGVPRCGDECFVHTSPQAAMDAAGNTIVAWTRKHDSHADIVAQVLAP